jgi:Uncharacterised nucleotidyltransferase
VGGTGSVSAMAHLVAALRDPDSVLALNEAQWSALLSVARAEVLIGTLAYRIGHLDLPPDIAATLAAARTAADQAQTQALWEAEMCRRALAKLGIAPILLKGTAYAAARLPNAAGRQIGDLDILVPRDRLDEVEAALLGAGWEWVKNDPYDQTYYREHMHELPPLIHKTRDRMIDVHHTILPLTARPRPNAAAMISEAVSVPRPEMAGLMMLSPTGIICHAAAHLVADGDLAGGLRNLWDIDRLCRHFAERRDDFYLELVEDASKDQLYPSVNRALRLCQAVFGTPLVGYVSPAATDFQPRRTDRLFIARILARDDWGRETRPLLRLVFYIRSHLLRMPLTMLLRHLWVKWRR